MHTCCSTFFSSGCDAMAILNEGQAAPAFALSNQDGKTVKLADLKGKNVIFWFYPRADTPG
jgi:thioredoxin-dependent peroxiredoxin